MRFHLTLCISPLRLRRNTLQKYGEQAQAAIPMAEIGGLDKDVCPILETLDEQRLRRNTQIVLLSTIEVDRTGWNAPLRSGKEAAYEGGICVPCLSARTTIWRTELLADDLLRKGDASRSPPHRNRRFSSLRQRLETDPGRRWTSVIVSPRR